MLRGLAHLHANGIVHRDVKPENLLFVDEPRGDAASGWVPGTLKLADLGIARMLRGGEKAQTLTGTPAYVAPELARLSRGVGDGYAFPVDVWATGCVLYLLILGAPPFFADDPKECLSLVEKGAYAMDAKAPCSDGVRSLIAGLLHPREAARMTAKEALQDPWVVSLGSDQNLGVTLAALTGKRKVRKVVKGLSAARRMRRLSAMFAERPPPHGPTPPPERPPNAAATTTTSPNASRRLKREE